jgi:ketosteroid isomerase-like protein
LKVTSSSSVEVIQAIFDAVERRDNVGFSALCDPEAEFHWPPSLPYGGVIYGVRVGDDGWAKWWNPLQPTEAEKNLHPRIVAASDHEVIVLWRQRGLNPAGERFDSEVLGLYEVRNGRLVRAQMFYFDPVAASSFLEQHQSSSM